ncbi:IgGFc-binding protein-like [Mizuhopecten yessoensis]|uniref:IgGFc-binding protein-like n=1 Tax=Mizuhopecten yessoensis TaxID=6573 RepID=UPI000B45B339|nr:IgGFc-binding protein-like [Mizuhopecten yessoensis]
MFMGTYTFLAAFLVLLVSLQHTTAIRCLSCDDVIQPRHCSVIKHCPDGDSCVTQAYRNENGEYLYDLGCMSAQRCSFSNTARKAGTIGKHVESLCTECCHSDLCNAAGCGTDGFPSRRGPVCLDCPQSRDPAFCDVISVCLEGEFCHVEETHQFGDVFYKTGCLRDSECASPPVYNPVAVGRRSTTRHNCFSCCSGDLCNAKCSNASSNPVICEDKTPDCPFNKDHLKICSDTEAARRMGCLKTCNLCSSVATSIVSSAIPTTTTLGPKVTTSPAPSTMPSLPLAPIQIGTVTPSVVPSTIAKTTMTPVHHSFKGKEVFLMFMENYSYIYSLVKLSAIVTFESPNSQLRVTTCDVTKTTRVSGPANQIDIDANLTMRSNGKTSKGIILTSDTPISVTAFNSNDLGLFEGYHALPIETLGTSYIVGTSIPEPLTGSSFAVGAPYDNTEVNITLSTSGVSVPGQYHREGDKITVVLDKLDTFYIETNSKSQDLTGTRIVSNKPVAVVSGNLCSNGQDHCNHLVEYLPPVSTWGSKFMVPPIMNTTRGIVRVVSSVNTTNVNVNSLGSNKTYTISTNFIDIDTNSSQPYAISSDQPVLVLLFPIKSSIGMTLVPSIDQFAHDPVLVSPPYGTTTFENYIVVSIRTSDESGLQLRSEDGTDLPRIGSVTFPDAVGEEYSFISATCNNHQNCSVQHTDDNAVFSVISYGLNGSKLYADPANLSL